jgi:hypothetical protein
MKRVKDFLVEYCKVCLDIETPPKGLDHNTEFTAFVENPQPAAILIGFEEKTNSFVIGTEGGQMDAWILLMKEEGDLGSIELSNGLQVTISSDIDEVKALLTGHILDQIAVDDKQPDSVEYQLLEVLKADLYNSPKYLNKIKGGEMSTISTFEDEKTIQLLLKNSDKSKTNARFAELIDSISGYTDPTKNLNGAQLGSSIKEIIECFTELVQPTKAGTLPYEKTRVQKLIEIYAEKLYKEAHKENSQIDLFDYENCNMRLKLSMWKDILANYMDQIAEMSTKLSISSSVIFEGAYSDYIKKLGTANYLRGIYDELIRYCKYFDLKECDDKLADFNQRRKDEKMSAKVERDTFFKEFTP